MKEKSETRGKNGQVSGVELGGTKMPTWEEKNGQVSDSRIRGIYYPPEKRKKDSPCSPKAKIKEEDR